MEANQPGEPGGQIAAYHDEIAQIQKEGHELTIRKARNVLFVAAGLVLLSYIISMVSSPEIINIIDMGIMVFFVGAFTILAFWTKKKPYTAIIGGITVFALFIIFNVAVRVYQEGATGIITGLLGGWLFKVIILVALIRPLKDAKELQEMMEQKA
jgi:prepilin signal peptidase PulO-like enzyme (type II secretory pathway)